MQQFHYSSKEQETIGVLKQAFSHIEQESQFAIGHYRIDLYLPKQKIAVECDENGHADRDPMAERERETYIKNHLDCRFLRFNPDIKNFNIYTVIQKLMMMIYHENEF